jgi:predicted GNAT superfamily acetyltransferase
MKLENPKNSRGAENQRIETQYASSNDIQGILSVQKGNLLLEIAPDVFSLLKQGSKINEDVVKEIGSRGFLIHALTEEELQRLISDRENIILLVTKENNEVDGYVLGYDINAWKKFKPEWEETVRVSEDIAELLGKEKILYLRHIARKGSAKGKGSKLMEMLINEAKSKGYKYIICEILEKPITNRASIEFHERWGFKKIGQVEEGHLMWGLFLKSL